jgi:FtsH-binding integral membrane protein
MQSVQLQRSQTQVLVNEFIRSVYNWMAIGLGLTGFVAFYVSTVLVSPVLWHFMFPTANP